MALLDSKQLNPKLTGSFILSGSTQTFIGASSFQGSITANANISSSVSSTGSFGGIYSAGVSRFVGNVGIGTTSPVSVLHVAGAISGSSITTNGDITLDNGTANGPNLILKSAGSTDWSMDNSTGAFRLFRAGALEGLNIDASYNATFGGNVSGSSTSTGSFGRVDTTGDIYASGRVYEAGSSVIDHATAMAIVFGG